MIYKFDSEVAALVGINAAVIFDNIGFWAATNAANERNYFDGHYWTYNSINAFQTLFPFLSVKNIRTALEKLESGGFIISGCYSENKRNRTKWYALSDKGRGFYTRRNQQQQSISQNGNLHLPKTANAIAESGKCTIYTDNKQTDDKQRVRARAREAPPFENPSPSLVDAWNGFVEMRKLIKKPLTPRASKLTADNLQKLAPDDDEHKAAILNQSVQNCWQGVFPLHDDWSKKRASPKPRGQQSVQDMTDETMEILRRQGLV